MKALFFLAFMVSIVAVVAHSFMCIGRVADQDSERHQRKAGP